MAYPFVKNTHDGELRIEQHQRIETVMKEIEDIMSIGTEPNRQFEAKVYKDLMHKMWALVIKMVILIYKVR